jgi:hypothetical protein
MAGRRIFSATSIVKDDHGGDKLAAAQPRFNRGMRWISMFIACAVWQLLMQCR